MRVYLWVFILITFVGSSISSVGNELIAQNSELAPTSVHGINANSERENYVCPDDEFLTLNSLENNRNQHSGPQINACSADFKVEPGVVNTSNSTSQSDRTVIENDEQISLLPNPEIEFIDEYMIKFDSFKSKDTVFYGGVLPFVALPDDELATEDSFFNEESFSVFLYFKRKF